MGLEFLQLVVTGPPGAGKTYYINQIRGWPNEGFIDFTSKKWWKNQSLIYRPREVHLGLPFADIPEALTVFDQELLERQPLPPLEPDRLIIPPDAGSFFGTDWKRKYVFEFIIPSAKTVYSRRKTRHKEGYFPIDNNLSLEVIRYQRQIYQEVALYLHRAGMQVYIRKELLAPPLKIVEKGDVITPMWLLPRSERSGVLPMKKNWKNFFFPRRRINWFEISHVLQQITSPCRIAHDGKSFELHLGKNRLHFHPEIPLGVKKKNIEKNWQIFSPHFCSTKNILGFARLCAGESVTIGRDNKLYTDLFDLDKTVASRHVQITNRSGDLIITPLQNDTTLKIMRTEEVDHRERVEHHRYEALISIQEIYGGAIEPLSSSTAITLLEKAIPLFSNDPHTPHDRKGKSGGIVHFPEHLTPVIIGDLHGQVNNLLKILSENSLLECLYANTVGLVILGDAVHSEIAGEMEKMESSVLIMDLLLTLKKYFPSNIFYLRGNHDSFSPDISKNGIPQGVLMKEYLLKNRGEKYVQTIQHLYDSLPYISIGRHFFCCHAAPPVKKVHYNDLLNIHDYTDLQHDVTTLRVLRPNYLSGYTKKDIKRFRKTLGINKGTPFIVGHTPMDPFGSCWFNAGNIKNHHVIYSGHQNGGFALLVEENNLIPLNFPHEPTTQTLRTLS